MTWIAFSSSEPLVDPTRSSCFLVRWNCLSRGDYVWWAYVRRSSLGPNAGKVTSSKFSTLRVPTFPSWLKLKSIKGWYERSVLSNPGELPLINVLTNDRDPFDSSWWLGDWSHDSFNPWHNHIVHWSQNCVMYPILDSHDSIISIINRLQNFIVKIVLIDSILTLIVFTNYDPPNIIRSAGGLWSYCLIP